jgi:hypothetical protein
MNYTFLYTNSNLYTFLWPIWAIGSTAVALHPARFPLMEAEHHIHQFAPPMLPPMVSAAATFPNRAK